MTDLVQKEKIVQGNQAGSLAESFLQARNSAAESNLGLKPQESVSQAALNALGQARAGLAELSGHQTEIKYEPNQENLNLSPELLPGMDPAREHRHQGLTFMDMLKLAGDPENTTYEISTHPHAA